MEPERLYKGRSNSTPRRAGEVGEPLRYQVHGSCLSGRPAQYYPEYTCTHAGCGYVPAAGRRANALQAQQRHEKLIHIHADHIQHAAGYCSRCDELFAEGTWTAESVTAAITRMTPHRRRILKSKEAMNTAGFNHRNTLFYNPKINSMVDTRRVLVLWNGVQTCRVWPVRLISLYKGYREKILSRVRGYRTQSAANIRKQLAQPHTELVFNLTGLIEARAELGMPPIGRMDDARNGLSSAWRVATMADVGRLSKKSSEHSLNATEFASSHGLGERPTKRARGLDSPMWTAYGDGTPLMRYSTKSDEPSVRRSPRAHKISAKAMELAASSQRIQPWAKPRRKRPAAPNPDPIYRYPIAVRGLREQFVLRPRSERLARSIAAAADAVTRVSPGRSIAAAAAAVAHVSPSLLDQWAAPCDPDLIIRECEPPIPSPVKPVPRPKSSRKRTWAEMTECLSPLPRLEIDGLLDACVSDDELA